MHQRAALQTGEDGAVDGFLVLALHQNDAAARTAQAFVSRGRNHIGMWHRVGVDACGDQACVVRHVDQEDRADVFGDFGKTLEINRE